MNDRRPRRILVIHNPTAGGAGGRRLRRVIAALERLGARVDLRPTARRGDAEAIARAVTRDTCDLLVVAGGDGTINEAVNGLHGTSPVLGIVPLGTANVLAIELGLSSNPAAICDAVAAWRVGDIRVGRANGRRFTMMAGVGFDAAVVGNVDPALKRRFGKGAYGWQIFREWLRFETPALSCRIDGAPLSAGSLIAAKGRHYGGGFTLARDARLDEPRLHAVAFVRAGRLDILRALAALPFGRASARPGVVTQSCRTIEIDGPSGSPVHADGDIIGALPVTIEIDPDPVRVLLAPSGRPRAGGARET